MSNLKRYDISLDLDPERLPDESALIEQFILNGTLGTFLYTVTNDLIEGRYNLQEGHTKIILDKLIETVTAIFSTVGSMDGNIQNITEVLNDHTTLLGTINNSGRVIQLPKNEASEVSEVNDVREEVSTSIDELNSQTPQIEAKDLILDFGDGDDGELQISDDIEDLFGDSITMDSGIEDF